MAKNTSKPQGRYAQMWEIWKLTAKSDKQAVPVAIGGGIAALAVVLLLGLITGARSWSLTIWVILGVIAGLITAVALISRRAEKMAYARIEGQPGAVGAILQTVTKRGWSGSEEPVAVNAKSQDLLYRVSGRGGIVLIAEGHRSSVSRLVEDEKRKLAKVASGVPVTVFWVCGDEHSIRLGELSKSVFKLPKVVRTSELGEINRRLSTMRLNVPVPKGIDPTRVKGMSKPR
jgi:hypothetical protein